MRANGGRIFGLGISFLIVFLLFLKGCQGTLELWSEENLTRTNMDMPISLNEGKGSYEGITIRQLEGENAPVYVFENGMQLFPLSGAPCETLNFNLDPDNHLGPNRSLTYVRFPEGDYALMREIGTEDQKIPIIMNNGMRFSCP